jgi:hypothetical protein
MANSYIRVATTSFVVHLRLADHILKDAFFIQEHHRHLAFMTGSARSILYSE